MTENGKHVEEGAGPEDQFSPEGYDESQRSEILEAEGIGPTEDAVQTDILPDLGGGDADDDEIEDDEDALDTIEDTDEPFRTLNSLGGDLNPGSQDRGNEGDVNRQDTQRTT